jgi:Mg-chelatase subunit ChlI
VNPALADLLDADNLRRLEALYGVVNAQDFELRSASTALRGLAAKYALERDLLRDLVAAQKAIESSIDRSTIILEDLGREYMKLQGERKAEPDPVSSEEKPAVLH